MDQAAFAGQRVIHRRHDRIASNARHERREDRRAGFVKALLGAGEETMERGAVFHPDGVGRPDDTGYRMPAGRNHSDSHGDWYMNRVRVIEVRGS